MSDTTQTKTQNSSEMVAQILIEAMPYIQRFHGKTIVIKYGGNAMIDKCLQTSFARDVVLLKLVGMNPIVVHGGGPQINQTLAKAGITTEFIDGIRVTDKQTMDIVEMVLGGIVNKEIVSLINSQGGKARGFVGKDGQMIRAQKISNGKTEVDYGHVGEVVSVDPSILEEVVNGDVIPVIAPIGNDEHGLSYNINADSVAGALASHLQTEKLVLMTNTAGVLNTNGDLLRTLNIEQVRALITDGTIKDGMLPKIECALTAVSNRVKSTTIIDGRVDHALLLEVLTDQGIGTLIVT